MDRRKKRTSTNQYMLYIELMERDTIFASGKIPRDVDMNYLSKKWKELSDKLNQCSSGPTLTAEEWRKRLNDWKNTTRSKYRRSLSGEKDISMTTLEMKALDLFGKAPQLGSTDQVSLHLKSEKDDVDDEMEHQRTSESLQKELQAAVEEAIGGGDDEEEEAMVEDAAEHEDELLEDALTTSVAVANSTVATDTGDGGGTYRTIVVENAAYVDGGGDEQVEYITSRRQPMSTAQSVQTVLSNATSTNAKLINGGIPMKRLRAQNRDQIVYEVKNTHAPPQTHLPRYTTIQTTATPISIHQTPKPVSPDTREITIDSQDASAIAEQLKRLADIKHEKLKFQLACFKFKNPGFQYNFPPAL